MMVTMMIHDSDHDSDDDDLRLDHDLWAKKSSVGMYVRLSLFLSGLKVAMCTNDTRARALMALDHFRLRDEFDLIVACKTTSTHDGCSVNVHQPISIHHE